MTASQDGFDARPPFEGYRILTDYQGAAFLHMREAASALQLRPEPKTRAKFVADVAGRQFRITGTPPETAPLFVAGFFMHGNRLAVFRECVEDRQPSPEETRYLVLLNLGDDWRIKLLIAGPTSDSVPFARAAIESIIETETDR